MVGIICLKLTMIEWTASGAEELKVPAEPMLWVQMILPTDLA